jgi:hypothetical protein
VIQGLIILCLGCLALILGALAYGAIAHAFERRKAPLRISTHTVRRVRWLHAELGKELDKAIPEDEI